MSDNELKQIIEIWNNTERNDININTCVHSLVESQVEKTPSKIALQSSLKSYTYQVLYRTNLFTHSNQEMNETANRLARFFISKGVNLGTFVGVCFTRDIEAVIVMLALIKIGAVYICLDPTYPARR